MVGLGRTQAINAGDRGHDDHVVAVEERAGGGMAHPVDGLVDGGVLFDVEVRLGDVGFGLVVIVITDKIFDGVVREKLLELTVELGRQGLVGGQDQGGEIHLDDDIGHREGLAGAGDPQQYLMGLAAPHPPDQLPDGPGLIPFGLIGSD